MSKSFPATQGGYTDFLTSVAAGDVFVAGLPHGSAGSVGAGNSLLSSAAAAFHVAPDTAHAVAEAVHGLTRKLMPARPATQASVTGAEFLSVGD